MGSYGVLFLFSRPLLMFLWLGRIFPPAGLPKGSFAPEAMKCHVCLLDVMHSLKLLIYLKLYCLQ